MDKPITSITEGSAGLYCPTCNTPRSDIKDTEGEVFKTFYCLNCGQALGFGILLEV